jgi:hypothetical protein
MTTDVFDALNDALAQVSDCFAKRFTHRAEVLTEEWSLAFERRDGEGGLYFYRAGSGKWLPIEKAPLQIRIDVVAKLGALWDRCVAVEQGLTVGAEESARAAFSFVKERS